MCYNNQIRLSFFLPFFYVHLVFLFVHFIIFLWVRLFVHQFNSFIRTCVLCMLWNSCCWCAIVCMAPFIDALCMLSGQRLTILYGMSQFIFNLHMNILVLLSLFSVNGIPFYPHQFVFFFSLRFSTLSFSRFQPLHSFHPLSLPASASLARSTGFSSQLYFFASCSIRRRVSLVNIFIHFDILFPNNIIYCDR